MPSFQRDCTTHGSVRHPLLVIIYEVRVEDKRVIGLTVQPSSGKPVLADGAAFVRMGTTQMLATSSEILRRLDIPTRGSAADISDRIEHLTRLIESQSKIVENLRQQLASAGSWKSRILDWMLGGVVGAVIGLLLGQLLAVVRAVSPHIDLPRLLEKPFVLLPGALPRFLGHSTKNLTLRDYCPEYLLGAPWPDRVGS